METNKWLVVIHSIYRINIIDPRPAFNRGKKHHKDFVSKIIKETAVRFNYTDVSLITAIK